LPDEKEKRPGTSTVRRGEERQNVAYRREDANGHPLINRNAISLTNEGKKERKGGRK